MLFRPANEDTEPWRPTPLSGRNADAVCKEAHIPPIMIPLAAQPGAVAVPKNAAPPPPPTGAACLAAYQAAKPGLDAKLMEVRLRAAEAERYERFGQVADA